MSLRALMLLIVVVAAWLGWICHRARVQREAVAAIEGAGGTVFYDWQLEPATLRLKAGSPYPGWFRGHLGPGFFEEVIAVTVFEAEGSEMAHIGRFRHLQSLDVRGKVTDAGLAQITGLTDLRWLFLSDTGITDTGLATIASLTNLQALDLSNTRITNAGLARLAGLRRCQSIIVFDTKVTPEGIVAMKSKCPWMTIHPDGTTGNRRPRK
jgi:hypothetical protein